MATRDWYAQGLNALAAWWANFIVRRAEFAAKYAVLTDKAAELNAAGAWIAYWVAQRNSFSDGSQQFTAYFNTIAGNNPSAEPPKSFNWALAGVPPAEPTPGIEFLIREVRREVVGLTNYAKADGEALGFESSTKEAISEMDLKPTIQAFGAATNHHFSIVVSGRDGIDMWDVYILRKDEAWTKIETCSGKSADISVSLTTPGNAEQIQVRVQLRKNNADYGQASDPVYVTLNP
ncbi:MAG: hypothetical protein IPI64_12975 [Chloracidobacterium sp.]|nr:hypothetical protein [Chloracidobacterium sp.]